MLQCFIKPMYIGRITLYFSTFHNVPMSAPFALADMRKQWHGLCQRLAPLLSAENLLAQLLQAYTEPHRFYHTIEHITMCLRKYNTIYEYFYHPDEVAWALWLHDAIYNTHAHDNEEQSALLSARILQEGGANPTIIDRTTRLIMATSHRNAPLEYDTHYIVDIDLVILGTSPQVFAVYEENIRREYAWVSEKLYREKRKEMLTSFLQREHIYYTPYFRTRYEHQARTNVKLSLAQLA